MITHDQLQLESIIYWSKDVFNKFTNFAPRMNLNFDLVKTDLKKRLGEGLFARVDPNYRRVVECTRLRWAYFDCETTLSLSENSVQFICYEPIKDSWDRRLKVFSVLEMILIQSPEGRADFVSTLIQLEIELYEQHKAKLRNERKIAIENLRDQLEKLESEMI
jgi:hypothetical protein